MEQHHSDIPRDYTDPKPQTLTKDQMQEFLPIVAKEMQLRAQRSQPEAQRSTTRNLQTKRRDHGSRVLRHLKRRRGY